MKIPPELRKIFNESAADENQKTSRDRNLLHLEVLGRGDHLVIYFMDEGEKTNRARLTRQSAGMYQLGFADHRGKWDTTHFSGTIPELIDLMMEQFSFLLTEF